MERKIDWSVKKPAKKLSHKEINSATKAYLARGGKIRRIESNYDAFIKKNTSFASLSSVDEFLNE
jgi:hypothetical protein